MATTTTATPIQTFPKIPQVQSDHARFKVIWEDEMKAFNKYVHHKHVFALLLFWENTDGWSDMQTEEEVDRLADVLQNVYNFQVVKTMFRPTGQRVQAQMNKYLSDFVHEYDHLEDTLLIVYYAGHGWALPGGRGDLQLAGHTELNMSKEDKKRLSIHWNKSEHNIQHTDGDVLVILDCCESGTLNHRGLPRGRKFELLAACGHDKTTSFPGKNSFTSALIWALQELAKEDPPSPFSTCKLRLKIAEEAPYFSEIEDQSPLLYPREPSSDRFTSDEHIMIEILKQSADGRDEVLGISRQDDNQVGDYADFRLHFTGCFSEAELRKAAREMKGIIKSNEMPLRSISYLKRGNALREFATTWLERTRRKSSASPQTPLTPGTRLEVPQSNSHSIAPASYSDSSKVTPFQSRRLSASTLNDEESPLLPTRKGDILPFHNQSGVRYHLRELFKCVRLYFSGWLWRSRSS
ncbi:MAG: hypothetical protein Q9160_009066, partial [Pyrenula sp. 1 TL-2023]